MLRILISITVLIFTSFSIFAQPATKRVALVVGVTKYREPLKPLQNPVRDARRIAEVLALNGFVVTYEEDPDHASFAKSIDAFAETSPGAEEAIIFFSGHGMAVVDGGKLINALAPVDAEIDCKTRNARRIIGMEHIIERLAHIPKKVALFDACRNDPFVGCSGPGAGGYGFREITVTATPAQVGQDPTRSASGSVGRGFEVVPAQSTSNMLISYASDLGGLALDGEPGKHSPFAEALLAELEAGGRKPFAEMLDKTSKRVASLTNSFQVPWVVTRGGEPDMCLAGVECEARGRLRQERALSDALGAAFDAERLRGTKDLHDALARVKTAIESLKSAGIGIPQPLLRQFQELLVLTPKRQLVRVEDLKRLGLSVEPGALGDVKFSGDGRIGTFQDDSGRVVVLDFEKMKIVQRLPGSVNEPSEVSLSARGDRAVMCRYVNMGRKCVLITVADGRIERTFDLPEGFSSSPVFAPNDAFVAWADNDFTPGRRGYKIIIEPIGKSGSRVTINLPRDEEAKKKNVVDGLHVRIALDGKELAVLSPARLHLFRETAGTWSGAMLDGIYDRLDEPYGANTTPSFDFDFVSRRFAFANPSVTAVIGDVEVAGNRLVLRQRFQFKDCNGCSVLGFVRGGREVVLAGLGTDGHVGVFALPERLEWSNVGAVFQIRQTALDGHFGPMSQTLVVYDIDGTQLQRIDLAGHPIRRSFALAGRDEVYVMPGRQPGQVVVNDKASELGFDFDPTTGTLNGEHPVSEKAAYDYQSSRLGPGARVDPRLFLHDDRYGRERVVAAASGTKDNPTIRFYLPTLGVGSKVSSETADERTLVLAGNGNGRIDVLTLPLSIEEQLATSRQILGSSDTR